MEKEFLKFRLILIITLTVFLAACSRSNREAESNVTPLPPAAAVKVQQFLANELGISPNQVTILNIQTKQWSNSCLDAQAEGEICAQQVTPGYSITLGYGDGVFAFHTDLEGYHFRQVQQDITPSPAALQSRQLLAAMLRYEPEAVRIVSEEAVRFSDSCLGIAIPETICAQVQIRGRRIILETDRTQFEFRTADGPIDPQLAVAAGIKGGDQVIMLSREGGLDNRCDYLDITLSGYVIQYSCQNLPGEVPGITVLPDEEKAQLLRWMLTYTSYDVTQTRQNGEKLRVTFIGAGTENPTFEEQEIIREFSEELIRLPAPFPTPLPTLDPEG